MAIILIKITVRVRCFRTPDIPQLPSRFQLPRRCLPMGSVGQVSKGHSANPCSCRAVIPATEHLRKATHQPSLVLAVRNRD